MEEIQLKPFLGILNVSPNFFLQKVCRRLKKVQKHCSRAGLGNVRPAKHLNVARELRLNFLTNNFHVENMLKIQKMIAL